MSDELTAELNSLGRLISYHANEISSHFSGHPKVTILVRYPGEPDADFIFTEDEDPELLAMISRRFNHKEPAP